ncbi:BON domain-containing protein [Paraburkholderia bannensis]|uniref:BON domain-containing protein n=1 Tax=Paraburkholderia bannensis TaxID=765414 RepID=UPI002AB2B8CD|nr:BON domain-containing protein [Paraburkholderia bannensis]
MKTHQIKWLAAGLLGALISVGVGAQGSDAATQASAAVSGNDAHSAKAADRALQKAVVRALSKTKGLRVSMITVRAHDGVVTLEGLVPEQSQVELAGKVAQGVPGVAQVKNALTLSSI